MSSPALNEMDRDLQLLLSQRSSLQTDRDDSQMFEVVLKIVDESEYNDDNSLTVRSPAPDDTAAAATSQLCENQSVEPATAASMVIYHNKPPSDKNIARS